ncbi:MAG: hypothetical protein ABID38_02905 [Candidatus Diapherotrites archaeon]
MFKLLFYSFGNSLRKPGLHWGKDIRKTINNIGTKLMKEFGIMNKWGVTKNCEEPSNKAPSDETWKMFLIRHWKMSLLMIAGSIGAVIVALFVFLWVVADTQATGLVPTVLGQLTVGYCVTFILTLILWEIVFVGIWAIPAALIIYFLWYKKLPAEERKEYEGGRRRSSGESLMSFLSGVIWLVIVWLSGWWDLAFQAWTLNDWIYTWLTAWVLAFLIVGIPGIIYVLWSLVKK